jgi:hypothetical protein
MGLTVAESGRKRKVGTTAKKKLAAPLLVQKLPHKVIADLLQVSERTVGRWASDDLVKAEVNAVVARAREATEARIVSLVEGAFDAMLEIVTASDDERLRFDAAKTIFDRWGHPAVTETKGEGTQHGVQILVQAGGADLAQWAREPVEEG